MFEAQSAKRPSAIAIVFGAKSISYADLDIASNLFAESLSAENLGAGKRLGILLNRSIELVIAILGVLKAGSAFVPLDPNYPADRINFATADAQLAAIISSDDIKSNALSRAVPIIGIGDAYRSHERVKSFYGRSLPDEVAYIIYTSGSTGRPKGVEIEHRSLSSFLDSIINATDFKIDSTDVFLGITTISFDMAILEILLPLIAGARLVIASSQDGADPQALAALLESSSATIMQATPVTWNLLVDSGWRGRPELKMISGGDVLSRTLAKKLLKLGCELWNGYGPTETTVYSSFTRVVEQSGPIPIGPPLTNQRFYVVDAAGAKVPLGIEGELLIGGAGLARGYFGRDDLTAERFITSKLDERTSRVYRTGDLARENSDGTYEYLGRNDRQIKLRGHRIELGEIEETLLEQDDVKDAAVIADRTDQDNIALIAFVVPQTIQVESSWLQSLRARLFNALPAYMVPAHIVAIDVLPKTPNNKIDRSALLPLLKSRIASEKKSPTLVISGTLRDRLRAIVEKLLGEMIFDDDADLFTLGFHSLLAARLGAEVYKAFDFRLSIRSVFECRTINNLEQRIERKSEVDEQANFAPIVTLNPNGSRPPFIYLHSDVLADGMYCRRLASMMPDQPIHAVSPEIVTHKPLLETVEDIAADLVLGLRIVQPSGPYRLGGFCAGGFVAFEVARLLQRDGARVDRLILINAPAPIERGRLDFDPLLHLLARSETITAATRESLLHQVAFLAQALNSGVWPTLQFAYSRVAAVLARLTRTDSSNDQIDDDFPKRSGTPETESYFGQLAATLSFHPEPYDGDIDLIWSSDENDLPLVSAKRWGSVARKVRVIPMNGGHVAPIHDRIDELGTALINLLR